MNRSKMGKTKKPKIKLSFEQTEKLINLVREHQCLYDQASNGYRDKILTGNIFKKIARKMEIPNFKGKQEFISANIFLKYINPLGKTSTDVKRTT